ncbi:hypothetical protein [Endozoicomonas sp.]|uniref:hypothetical protein n=1 Tax=Endozoicomonas sp. TaxID=1892382 RepID=UPI00288860F5|nr:hypothetical protein [Endozoicomonas sp.]
MNDPNVHIYRERVIIMDISGVTTTYKDGDDHIPSELQDNKDPKLGFQNGRAIYHTFSTPTNLDKTGRQADQPPPTNTKKLTFNQRISKVKSFIKTQLTGLPDFNDPAKTLDYIKSLEKQKKIKPFTRRLLTDIATHEQRVDILKNNSPFTYELFFHDADDPAKNDRKYVALHERNNELWRDLLIADSVPDADKNILKEKKLPVCIVIIPGAPEAASSSKNISPCKEKSKQSTGTAPDFSDDNADTNESYNLDWDDSACFATGNYRIENDTTPLFPKD